MQANCPIIVFQAPMLIKLDLPPCLIKQKHVPYALTPVAVLEVPVEANGYSQTQQHMRNKQIGCRKFLQLGPRAMATQLQSYPSAP